MLSKLIAFPLEQIFLTRDFLVVIFFFFINNRPSGLRKPEKGLLFTPNISPGDRGVDRHQAIVPSLLYDKTTYHGAFNLYTTERRHFTALPHLSAHALCQFSLIKTCTCESPYSVFATSVLVRKKWLK